MKELDEKKSNARVILDKDREIECAASLSGIFDELMECSIDSGQCRGIFFTEGKPRLSVNRTLEELRAFALNHVHPEECMGFLNLFHIKHLKEAAGTGAHPRLDFRWGSREEGYTWLRILLVPDQTSRDAVLCYVAALGEEERESHLLKQIVDRYVYRNCDYLICLDAVRDTYTMFRRNEETRLFPPAAAGPYSRLSHLCMDRYVAPEDRERVRREMDLPHVLEVLDREGEHVVTFGVVEQNREYCRKRFQYVYYDKANCILLLMGTDVTKEYREQCRQKKRLMEALRHARVDALTGLYNGRALHREIDRILGDAGCLAAVLLFIDLDHFKYINDTMGHRNGDLALRQASEVLRQTLRAHDLVGRVGGDEFIALLTGITPDKGMECAARLCRAMERLEASRFGGLKLSCSIGAAVYPRDGIDYDTLFLKADTAVYEAKHRGRNQWVLYSPQMGHSTISML